MKKIPELLAPAGNKASVIAAINGGADAVYFGGKGFNARRNAGNMTNEEIHELVTCCHAKKVKVYLTLNILIKDSELPEMLENLDFLRTLSVDGLIVQDLGLIWILQHYYPELKLQTSTQGSVFGLEGTQFFEALGFDRVVLPREMSVADIAAIKEKTNVALKVFAHGALCYAYSGQCLFSSMIGGRSGNRGLCAQPCRKYYRLLDRKGQCQKEGFLLSLKDLKTRDGLKEIVESGVDSLKIEGRMKSPEYVYAVTKAYRETLDSLDAKETTVTIDDTALKQVFNRSFTPGRILGAQDIIGDTVGKNRGIPIGKVRFSKKGRLGIQLDRDKALNVGDGLAFGESGKSGTRVDVIYDVQGEKSKCASKGAYIEIPCRIVVTPNTVIYRNLDAVLMTRLESAAQEKIDLKTKLDMKIVIAAHQPVVVKAASEGREIVVTGDTPSPAERNPLSQEMVHTQFSKLGGSSFEAGRIESEIEPNLFLAKSQMNGIRKKVVEKMLEAKCPSQKQPIVKTNPEILKQPGKDPVKRPLLSAELTRLSTYTYFAELPVDEIILPIETLEDLEEVAEAALYLKKADKRVLLSFPRRMGLAYSKALREKRALLKQLPCDGILLKNFEVFHILQNDGLFLEADQSFNIFNIQSTVALRAWGVQSIVLSPELAAKELKQLSSQAQTQTVLTVYGRQEVMISENCIHNCDEKHCSSCHKNEIYYLVDEREASFPFRKDAMGLTHVYNSAVLALDECLKEQPYLDKWRLTFLDETPERMAEICGYYHELLKGNRPLFPKETEGHYTKGNYKRGVE